MFAFGSPTSRPRCGASRRSSLAMLRPARSSTPLRWRSARCSTRTSRSSAGMTVTARQRRSEAGAHRQAGCPWELVRSLGGHNVLTLVAETEKPARVDGYDDASGEAAEIARHHGWRSSIAAPIIVEGRLWGVMLVATQRPEPFPAGAEERLAAFTDLVATALANAQAHDEVRRFGEEQAALGRVATLVAAGAAPEQVFTAVVDEVSSLLGLERIELVRYDGDATGTVIAASGDHPFPAGTSWSLDDPSVMATVARTGARRPHRRLQRPGGRDRTGGTRRRLSVGDRRTDHGRGPSLGRDHRDLDRSGADSRTVGSPSRPVHRARRDRSRKRRGARRSRTARRRAGCAAARRDARRAGSAARGDLLGGRRGDRSPVRLVDHHRRPVRGRPTQRRSSHRRRRDGRRRDRDRVSLGARRPPRLRPRSSAPGVPFGSTRWIGRRTVGRSPRSGVGSASPRRLRARSSSRGACGASSASRTTSDFPRRPKNDSRSSAS